MNTCNELPQEIRDLILRGSSEDIASAAVTLQAQGDHRGARQILEAAVMRSDVNPGIWHNLGIARSDSDDFEGAISAYTKAIDLGYPSYVNRGFNFEQLDQPEAAKKDYLEALVVLPNDVDAMVDLGTLELSLGSVAEATKWLTAAAALDPKANWQLADALVAAGGHPEEALTALNLAIAAGEGRAHLDLALLESEHAPRELVISHFLTAIEAGARFARRELAIYLDTVGDNEAALVVAQEGVNAGDTLCYAPLAVILESRGEFESAIKYYRLAIDDGDDEYDVALADLEERVANKP